MKKLHTSASTTPEKQAQHKKSTIVGDQLPSSLYVVDGIILLVSIVAHLPLLLVCGCIFLLALLIIDIWATYCLREIHYQRRLSEQRVLFGEEITLSISIENAKILPLPVLQVEDAIPRALPIKGQAIRKTTISNRIMLESLFSLRWYERVTRNYTVQCVNRGVYAFGPATLRSSDVFGFISRELKESTQQHILVYPLVVPIESFHLPTQRPFGDHRTAQRLLEDPSRVIGVRDYVYGDSMRRIDWKATARTLEMQSKIYESTTTYNLALFLNSSVQLDQYYSIHPALQELAICAAASISSWALDEGYTVGLYANTPMNLPDEKENSEPTTQEALSQNIARQLKRRVVRVPAASSEEQRQRILETLARIQAHLGTPLEEVLLAERTHLPAGTTIVVITNHINERLLEVLLRMRRGGHAVTLLLVGDNLLSMRISGISTYHLGGETTWDKLQAIYGNWNPEGLTDSEDVSGFHM